MQNFEFSDGKHTFHAEHHYESLRFSWKHNLCIFFFASTNENLAWPFPFIHTFSYVQYELCLRFVQRSSLCWICSIHINLIIKISIPYLEVERLLSRGDDSKIVTCAVVYFEYLQCQHSICRWLLVTVDFHPISSSFVLLTVKLSCYSFNY